MNRKTLIAALGLVAIAAVYVIFIRKTDEDRIRAQLSALAEAVHKSEGENELLRAVRVDKAFAGIFTREVELKIPEISEQSRPRQELAKLTVGASHGASKVALRYQSLRIEIDRPMARAWVTGTAVVTAARGQGLGDSETREVVIRFSKEESEWRIASVSTMGGDR